MTEVERAFELVFIWLIDGGVPNKEIPLRYDYSSVNYERGDACAGTALAYLLDYEDCCAAGYELFGDIHAFYGISFFTDVSDTEKMAYFVSYLGNVWKKTRGIKE